MSNVVYVARFNGGMYAREALHNVTEARRWLRELATSTQWRESGNLTLTRADAPYEILARVEI